MSLLFNELTKACKEKKLVRISMHNGAIYTGFVKNLDDQYLKIAHLDIVNNSDIDKGMDDLSEYMETGSQSAKEKFDEYKKEIDYIFCDKIIRLEMVDNVDFDTVHSLKPTTAQYVDFYKTHELQTDIKQKTKRVKLPLRVRQFEVVEVLPDE